MENETKKMVAEVHVRYQHSDGSSANTFGGPDTYVAVTVAPEGVVVPRCLRQNVLAKREIKLHWMGEGYREHQGPRSALGRAMAKARELAKSINNA